MIENATATQERTDKRTLRAEWEGFEFCVLTQGRVNVKNRSKANPSVYTVTVTNQSVTGCSCPDWEHREPEGGCKHMRAVEAQEAVTLAAGGREGDSTDKGRPADCDCHATFEELPCWPCYRDGFETPNPEVKADE